MHNQEIEREATDEERVLMDVNYRWSTFYSNEVHESSELEATDEHCSSKMVGCLRNRVKYKPKY